MSDEKLTVRTGDLLFDASSLFKAALVESGINQAELARRLGVTRPRISHIMSGDRNLTLRTVEAAAEALGYNVQLTLVKDD